MSCLTSFNNQFLNFDFDEFFLLDSFTESGMFVCVTVQFSKIRLPPAIGRFINIAQATTPVNR